MEWYNSLAKPSWTPGPSTINLIWMILYPDHPRRLRIRVREGFPGQGATVGRHSVRHQPCGKPAVHADLFGAAECAVGGGGHPDRVDDDHLVRRGRLAGLQMVALAQVPYFVWVSTATVIQASITAMNWGN